MKEMNDGMAKDEGLRPAVGSQQPAVCDWRRVAVMLDDGTVAEVEIDLARERWAWRRMDRWCARAERGFAAVGVCVALALLSWLCGFGCAAKCFLAAGCGATVFSAAFLYPEGEAILRRERRWTDEVYAAAYRGGGRVYA